MKIDDSERSKTGLVMILASISLAGPVLYLLIVGSLHFLRADINPVSRSVSEYAVGPYGLLMTLAFFAFGVGTLTLAIGLYRALSHAAHSIIGLILLLLGGVSLVVAGIFPTDLKGAALIPSPSGGIHILASLIVVPSLVLAFLLISRRFRHDENWRSVYPVAWSLAWIVLILFFAYFVTFEADFAGFTQRLFIGGLLSWLLYVTAHLRSVARHFTS